MDRRTSTTCREPDPRVFALCEDHLKLEESLLADLLHSLQQVRDAFVERNLGVLPSLQARQEQLLLSAQETAQARDRLRAFLGECLGIPADEVTLRAAAETLPEPQRERLTQRRSWLRERVLEADRLSQQSAELLGYARGFLISLFASLTGTHYSERYGPHGERRGVACGSFLEARG